jgi:hypothetical protein
MRQWRQMGQMGRFILGHWPVVLGPLFLAPGLRGRKSGRETTRARRGVNAAMLRLAPRQNGAKNETSFVSKSALLDQADLAFHALEAGVRAKTRVNGFDLKIDQGGTAEAEKLPKVLDCLVLTA